jgi:hypothetical protein
LIESVRKAGRAGRHVKLAAFDMSAAQQAAGVDRDGALSSAYSICKVGGIRFW